MSYVCRADEEACSVMGQDKFVYGFSEGSGDMENLLGGKGARLAAMCRLGLPVPQGFTITTVTVTQAVG